MGEILSYTLRSSLLLMAMYLVYKWMMAKENMHAFNRAALIAIYLTAMAVPLIPAAGNLPDLFSKPHQMETAIEQIIAVPVVELTDTTASTPIWPLVVIAIYLAGAAVMAALTVVSYIRLAQIVHSGEKYPLPGGAILVISGKRGRAPFSWRKYVVVSREDYTECGDMILTHELQHLHHNHWLDMLFAQLVIVAQWFNPAAWLMREELRSVNEYQADAAVLRSGVNARQYQLLLIKKAVGKSFPALANSLNHSNLKKRITMMLKSNSGKSRRGLALALAPAALAAVAVFNIPAVASVLSAVSGASFASLPHKVTTSEAYGSNQAAENSIAVAENTGNSVDIAVVSDPVTAGKLAAIAAPAESNTASTEQPKQESKESPKFIFKVDGKEILPNANGEYEYKGIRFSAEKLNMINSAYVESMSIDKQNNSIVINLLGEKEKPSNSVAKLPQFPGGDKALMQHIATTIKYPEGAPDDGSTYRVVVAFDISATGKVGATRIIRSQGEIFDNEAIRVITTLPDFEPAVNENGENVACQYTIPISFKAMSGE